jgi:hypothetical protein
MNDSWIRERLRESLLRSIAVEDQRLALHFLGKQAAISEVFDEG